MSNAIAPENLGWEELALNGEGEALSARLRLYGSKYPEKHFYFFVMQGMLEGAKTLLRAGVPTTETQSKLLTDSCSDAQCLINLDAVKLLQIAAAEPFVADAP